MLFLRMCLPVGVTIAPCLGCYLFCRGQGQGTRMHLSVLMTMERSKVWKEKLDAREESHSHYLPQRWSSQAPGQRKREREGLQGRTEGKEEEEGRIKRRDPRRRSVRKYILKAAPHVRWTGGQELRKPPSAGDKDTENSILFPAKKSFFCLIPLIHSLLHTPIFLFLSHLTP